MSQKQDLSSKLARARQKLKSAQTQVADLEAQLFADQPIPLPYWQVQIIHMTRWKYNEEVKNVFDFW